jgi:hypothetical protein
MTMKNNVENFNYHKMQSLFRDFGVHSEDELQIKLDNESRTVPCSICGKEINSGDFIDGDPICWDCANGDTVDD